MPSIDFQLPILEQLYVLPDTELVSKKEKELLLEFKRCHFLVFFREEMLSKRMGGPIPKDLELCISGGASKLTFARALDNLVKESDRLDSKYISKRIFELKNAFEESELGECIIMTHANNSTKKLSKKEIQLNTLMTFIEVSIPLDMLPLGQVAENIDVKADTIKQACQDGRVLSRKSYKSWNVNLEEAKEYWNYN